jgi:hypothetical protein
MKTEPFNPPPPTVEQMRERFRRQAAIREASIVQRTEYLTERWIAALDERIMWAHSTPAPMKSVSVFANSLTKPEQEYPEALAGARARVIAHFEGRGFKAVGKTFGDATGVEISWPEAPDCED